MDKRMDKKSHVVDIQDTKLIHIQENKNIFLSTHTAMTIYFN